MNPWEPYVLALGAVVGAYLKARWTKAQETYSRETLQDCFFALILGILWPYQVAVPNSVPILGGLTWPPFQLPATMPLPVKGALMAGLSALFIGIIKKILMQFPERFEAITGARVPTNGATDAAKKLGMIVLALTLAGCATAFLPPIEIKCRGKGTITGVAGPYGFTATGDCGEGFEYTRTQPK